MKLVRYDGIDYALFSLPGLFIWLHKFIERIQQMIARLVPRSVVLALAICITASIVIAQDNTVSRPVGFVRVRVPANDKILVSIPFLPFDESVSSVLSGQPAGDTNAPGVQRVMKWDSEEGVYECAVKVQGSGDGELDEVWLTDLESRVSSELTIIPGESFWIENESAREHNLYLWGHVVLDESISLQVEPGVNLIAYPFSTYRSVADATLLEQSDLADTLSAFAGGQYWTAAFGENGGLQWVSSVDGSTSGVPAFLEPGGGYAYCRNTTNALHWTEALPYADRFPTGGPPCVVSMTANDQGSEVSLCIACSGSDGETLDIMYQDAVAGERLCSTSGWRLADKAISTAIAADRTELMDAEESNSISTISWTDAGFGRGRVNTVSVRYYLIGRADIDSDGDQIPDARESFVYGTDCDNADSDGDGMPDGWELRNGLDPRSDDSNVDIDGDGRSNITEYERGTNPRSSREAAAVIYVDSRAGDDLYDGFTRTVVRDESGAVESGPKKTVKGAFQTSVPGDTVVVSHGVYGEGVSVPRGVKLKFAGTVTFKREAVR